MVHLEALVSFSAETTFLRDDENVPRDVFPAYLITHPKTDSFLESLCQPQRMQFAFEFALPSHTCPIYTNGYDSSNHS